MAKDLRPLIESANRQFMAAFKQGEWKLHRDIWTTSRPPAA